MLVFDIETTGLDSANHEVTVVCTEDFYSGEKKTYNFGKLGITDDAQRSSLLKSLVCDFNNAKYLCAYNGIRFDLPFMQRALEIPSAVVTAWVLKTVDLLEYLRLTGMPWSSLDAICVANGIATKTSSGAQAVQMAREGNWVDLEAYCAHDVFMLSSLYRHTCLIHPKNANTPIDMKSHAPSDFF
jgi:uncharacterized protein YprB with RNaseH-like and TPR domain